MANTRDRPVRTGATLPHPQLNLTELVLLVLALHIAGASLSGISTKHE
ncbi:hypothetical protein [Xenorhabdus vietnamensis]|nr:hypothetical protein [Xenorhabdus vietnamensis]